MEDEGQCDLLQPLSPVKATSTSAAAATVTNATATPTSSSNNYGENDGCKKKLISALNYDYGVTIRLLSVFLIAFISLWANYDTSKRFEINITNNAPKDSPHRRRFDVVYNSNEKASRILLNASAHVENILYPQNVHPKNKKHIRRVTIRLASWNLSTSNVIVTRGRKKGVYYYDYVIDLSPSIMEDPHTFLRVVQRAMARVWLWDGDAMAPPSLLDGMAEYILQMAGFGGSLEANSSGELTECGNRIRLWWEDEEPKFVARCLHCCEMQKKGFIQRLNEALKDTWRDQVGNDLLFTCS